MVYKMFVSLVLIYSISFAEEFPFNILDSKSNYFVSSFQDDSTLRDFSFPKSRANSLKSDLIRSAAGTAVGAFVGAGIVGYFPVLLNREYESRSFPDNSYYLRSYVGASSFAALFSATVLYFSKNREISYWKIASYSLIPPMILVMPLAVHASVNERDELVRATWIATMTSIGISTFWSVLVYRIHPVKKNDLVRISFCKPYLSYGKETNCFRKPDVRVSIKVIEFQF